MDRRAWFVVVIAALGAAFATWLLLRTETNSVERPVSSIEIENSRLRAEADGLRRRLDEALDAAARAPSLAVRPHPPSAPPAPIPASPEPAAASPEPAVPRAIRTTAQPMIGDLMLQMSGGTQGPTDLLDELAKRADLARILRDIAEDSSVDVARRTEALVALTSTGDRDVVDLVQRLLASRDATDQEVARNALLRARHPAFGPLLRDQLVGDPDAPSSNVNSSTLSALARLKGKAWAPVQATGEPDTPIGGDLQTAWASKQPEMGLVWLELDYAEAVRPDGVRVHETLAPGAVAQVLAKAEDGSWVPLWEGRAPRAQAPTWFEPRLNRVDFRTPTLRIVLDTDRVPGWNEIDAVELIGDGRRQWASDARASSSYSD